MLFYLLFSSGKIFALARSLWVVWVERKKTPPQVLDPPYIALDQSCMHATCIPSLTERTSLASSLVADRGRYQVG